MGRSCGCRSMRGSDDRRREDEAVHVAGFDDCGVIIHHLRKREQAGNVNGLQNKP